MQTRFHIYNSSGVAHHLHSAVLTLCLVAVWLALRTATGFLCVSPSWLYKHTRGRGAGVPRGLVTVSLTTAAVMCAHCARCRLARPLRTFF